MLDSKSIPKKKAPKARYGLLSTGDFRVKILMSLNLDLQAELDFGGQMQLLFEVRLVWMESRYGSESSAIV
jgi:hypothetical protein